VAPAVAGDIVTTAYISGVTYIYYAGTGCYTYDFAANTLNVQALAGLVAGNIRGVTAANGFLIAFGATAVYWSSTVSVVDFVPSLITGAGGGAVQDVRGTIVTVVPHKLGFMVYGTYNIVVGLYTANVRYPFALKEVVGSGGLPDDELADKDPVSGDHYAYTTSGLQLITSQVTNPVLPELTDFLAGAYFEDYDDTTNTFTTTHLSAPMAKKLASVGDRYLMMSYGISNLTHVILYDTALKRAGKLKIPHVDCFEYVLLGTNVVDTPRNCIAFMQADGTVMLANFQTNTSFANGCLILGKFQLSRQVMCDLVRVDLENVRTDANFTCKDSWTLDGKNQAGLATGYLSSAVGLMRRYDFRTVGMNHSLVFTGAFNLVSIVAYFAQSGNR
jgi:hypothetical protein